MRFSAASLPRWRLATLVVFTALTGVVFCYLWVHSGGPWPGRGGDYRLVLQSEDAQNLVDNSDVTLAGVKVGRVTSISGKPNAARIVVDLNRSVVPMHQGASFALRSKTLVEETYLDLTDGTGAALPSGASLPLTANSSSVHLDQVLDSLTPSGRQALRDLISVADASTTGRSSQLSSLMTGLGQLGASGHDALAALADQGADLQTLSRNTAQVLAALDERQGQIAHLTEVASSNMRVTADQRAQLARAVQLLPQVLTRAQQATPSLQTLGADLRPLAAGLKAAAPGLNQVLDVLPQTTAQLRATFPTLDDVLDKAPATLTRLPAFDGTLQSYSPVANQALAQLNPIVNYMAPYGMDLAAFFSNDSSAFGLKDATSRFVRVYAVLNSTSLVGDPTSSTVVGGVGENPYPGPHTAENPKINYSGSYPKVRTSP